MKTVIASLTFLALVVAFEVYAQWGYPSYHASTAGEGYQRGYADVIRSRGVAAQLGSQAAINMTYAQRNEIDNQVARTNAYFEMRRINREARAAENPQTKKTKEDWIRYAQEGMPQRLSPGELNTVSGVLSWPPLLQTADYADARAELNKLFAERAAKGTLSWNEQQEASRATDDMLKRLKNQIRDLPVQAYITSKQFLKSLAYEVRLAAS